MMINGLPEDKSIYDLKKEKKGQEEELMYKKRKQTFAKLRAKRKSKKKGK